MRVKDTILRQGLPAAALMLAAMGQAGHYQLQSTAGVKNPDGGTICWTPGSSVYSGSSGNYGASESDPSFVTCSGTITTIWVWVKDKIKDPSGNMVDDPLDTAPEEVISEESCTASFSGKYYLDSDTSGMYGDCDNGLGFDPVYQETPFYLSRVNLDGTTTQILDGYSFSGKSEGILYTKRAGGDTVTLTCTPSVDIYVWDGSCQGGVQYASRIIVPTVQQLGTTRLFNPDAMKFITGQNVNSKIVLASSTGGPAVPAATVAASFAVATYKWGFEGSGGDFGPFKQFICTNTTGRKDPLLDADFKNSAFNFFSVENGRAQVVCELTFTLPDKARLADPNMTFTAKSKEIESVRPAFMDWQVKDGQFNHSALSDPWPWRFEFGGKPSASGGYAPLNGQQWSNASFDVSVTDKTGTTKTGFPNQGSGCFCQIATLQRDVYRTVSNTSAYTHCKNKTYGVPAADTGYPYQYGTQWDVAKAVGTGADTPSQSTAITPPPDNYTKDWVHASANDTFQTWAMYCPPSKDGQPTAWIPMAKYSWKWNGEWVGPSNFTGSGKSNEVPYEVKDHPSWSTMAASPIQYVWYRS